MSKKRIKRIIWILVLALVLGTIFYLNRTVSLSYVSDFLREKGVVKINIFDGSESGHREDMPVTTLQADEIDKFYELFNETKGKIIRSSIMNIYGSNWDIIECHDSSGKQVAFLELNGKDLLGVYLYGDGEYGEKYRIKTEGWYEEFKKIIEG